MDCFNSKIKPNFCAVHSMKWYFGVRQSHFNSFFHIVIYSDFFFTLIEKIHNEKIIHSKGIIRYSFINVIALVCKIK